MSGRAPLPIRAAQHAYHRARDLAWVLRGKYILQRYSAHYRRARSVFPSPVSEWRRSPLSVRDVGVRVISPGAGVNAIVLPHDYLDRVSRVASAAGQALDVAANCRFVPAVNGGSAISAQLRAPLSLAGLEELSDALMTEIERTVYRSFAVADKVYVYRTLVSRGAPMASWLWHFDNHPHEMLKVMVYLTDVGDDSAPFEYLCDGRTGEPVRGEPLTPLYGNSRVPAAVIGRHLARGCETRRVTGPRGTIVLFDDNVIHRGTIARAAQRDVVVLQLRPATTQLTPRIDRRWTGTFGHWAINADPWKLAPEMNPSWKVM